MSESSRNNDSIATASDHEDSLAPSESEAATETFSAKKVTLHITESTALSWLIRSLQDPDCVVLYLQLHSSFIQKHGVAKIVHAFSSARLPNLLGIKVHRDTQNQTFDEQLPFPVRALSSLLRRSTKVEYLIFDLKLTGTFEDFKGLGEAFRLLGTLQCLGLTINVHEEEKANDAAGASAGRNPLDPLILALSKLPTLTDIIIKGCAANPMEDSLGALDSSGLRALCKLPKLASLYLFLFVLSNDNMISLSHALENNTSLKELCINCSLGITGSQALSRTFRLNSALAEIILIVTNFDDERNSKDDKQSSCKMENDHHVQCSVEADIAQGLADSSSLKEFLFQGGFGDMCHKSLVLFRNAVKSNYVVEKVCVRVGPNEADKMLNEEIKFFVNLNKSGRGKLLQDTSVSRDERWITMLATMGSELNNLHYFLSMNPALVCGGHVMKPSAHQRNQKASLSTQPLPSKRKRLYRAAKYQRVKYR